MVKAVAAGAVLVAAGIPVAMASTAGAATSPSLYCSQYASTTSVMYNYAGSPYCGSMPYGAQNSTFSFNLSGANFAFNAGSVSATTTATGVTVDSVTENNANSATVMLTIGATTAPGYYPLTLTDSNGSATLTNAFGVDPSGTVTNVSPSSVPEGSTTLVTVTGTGLTSGSVSLAAPIAGFTVTNGVANSAGTSLTFYVSTTSTLALGTYPVSINSVTSTNSAGNPGVDITVTGAAISSLTPSQLGHNATASTVTQNITINGSGFVAGAVVRINNALLPYAPFALVAGQPLEVQFGAATVVNSTTITVPVTTAVWNGTANNSATTWDVSVTNPNGTNYTATGALGWLMAGNAAYTTPAVSLVTNGLTPGDSTVTLVGNPAFPLSAGDVVTLTYGSFSFTGTMTSSTTAAFYLPQYLSTTLTSAVVAGATNLPVASLTGIATGTNLTFVDATGTTVVAAGTTAVTNTVQVPALAAGHAAGTSVEFPIQSVTGWTLSVNNGSTTLPIAGLTVGATPTSALSYMRTNGTSNTLTMPTPLAPGTYTFLYDVKGANLASTGTTVTFAKADGTNPDGITGTVSVTSSDTAWVTVKFPTTSSTPTYAVLTPTVGAATSAGQTSLPVSVVTGLAAGATYRLNNGQPNAENVTISPTWDGSTNPVPLSAAMGLAHASGESISSVSYTASSGNTYYATINNGNGNLLTDSTGFATTAASNVTVTGMAYSGATPLATPGLIIGSGASNVSVNITGAFTGSSSKYDYVVTSTTPGVTFGAVSGVVNGASLTGYITVPMSVASGTPVNTSVQFTVTELNGAGTSSLPTSSNPNSGVLIGNTPTITAVTGLPTSMKVGETATFGVTGTLFDATTVSDLNAGNSGFLADAGNLAGSLDTGTSLGLDTNGVSVSGCVLNSSTSITCSVTIGTGAANGAHDLMITNASNGSAVFASALTVANATIGAISPTFYQSDNSSDIFTLSGLTGFNVAQGGTLPSAWVTVFTAGGTPVAQVNYSNNLEIGLGTTTWVSANTVSISVPGNLTRPAGGFMVVSLSQSPSASGYNAAADAPIISLGLPLVITNNPSGFSSPAGTSGAFELVAGPSTFSSPFNGPTTFMPGAVVSVVPATNGLGISTTAGISVTGVTVLPGLISGTIAVSASTPSGTYTLQVLNPDGGVAYSTFTVSAAPSVAAVNGVPVISGPVSFLSGTQTTLTIAGSNLQDGAVVSASVPGDATFGTATANAGATVLTVPVTFTSFSGATPVVLDLTVTNPDGGTTTVTGEIVLNPQPGITGTPYYVPTFTTNKQIVVTGTGFQAGMTVSSSNADYTVSVANVTPTAVTLLVSTNSNATSGTSTTLTFTNPDGGTTTMTLNGGPVPKPAIKVIRMASAVWTGKRVVTNVIGQNMYGQPKITSNVGGTKVGVSHNTGTHMTIIVTVAKTTPRGVHTFTITFKNGEVFHLRYNQR